MCKEMHISLSRNVGTAWKPTTEPLRQPNILHCISLKDNFCLHSGLSAHSVLRLQSYLQRMRISKCLSPQEFPGHFSLGGHTPTPLLQCLSHGSVIDVMLSWQSRFFYGYNYNCKFPACQADLKNSQFCRIIFIPHSLKILPYQWFSV